MTQKPGPLPARTKYLGAGAAALALSLSILPSVVAQSGGSSIPNLTPYNDPTGTIATNNSAGAIDTTGPFFQSLGSNGRSCFSCHQPDQGWSVSAASLQTRFNNSQGLDPVFATVDGSNCNTGVDVTTLAGRKAAFTLLTSRGLIRIALPVPASAEYTVTSVNNQYGCGNTATISTYRRPLPSTNLRFLSSVMWDGRESSAPATEPITYATNPGDLIFDLTQQAINAVTTHEQGIAPPAVTARNIVNFEMGLATAQATDNAAGSLSANGATGGPVNLSNQAFYVGINDSLGADPRLASGAPAFSPAIFNLFNAWNIGAATAPQPPAPAPQPPAPAPAPPPPPPGGRGPALRPNAVASATTTVTASQASIARGEVIFNTRRFAITGVAGLNDLPGRQNIPGSCGTCHDSPNVGNHSFALPLNIGVADVNGLIDTTYLPAITLKNTATGQSVTITDPGTALTSGKWADVGKFKVPVLRGLAARAPYFHNGSAASLGDVVNFYDRRFRIGLTPQDKADLIAFLSSL